MCWRPRKSPCENSVAYLVRSLRTCARIRSLTTGTFNLIVKDRIADRLSGTNSVQPETHKCASGRPRNPTNIPCWQKPCQSAHPTEFPRDFHIGTGGAGSGTSGAKAPFRFGARRGPKGPLFHPDANARGLRTRNSMAFRLDANAGEYTAFRARANGRQKIEKRTCFWRSLL